MRITLDNAQLKIVKLALTTLATEDISKEKPVADILNHVEECENESKSKKRKRYVEAAQKRQEDGKIEIDDDAVVSYGEDPVAYVMAWIWVSDEELKA